MEKIRIIILEDEIVIAEDLRARLVQNEFEVTGVFDNAEAALPIIKSACPDLLLVDIRLAGQMDGITMVEEINQTLRVPVIYITANSDDETYKRARETKPNAFLVKPFTPANLLAAIDLALYNFSAGVSQDAIDRPAALEHPVARFLVNQFLFIRYNGRYKKIGLDDLLFAEAAGSYVNIQTTTERYTLSENLSNFQKRTPLQDMVRIHRSYIVNLKKIDSFEESYVFIQNHKLPIGSHYKEGFLAHIHLL